MLIAVAYQSSDACRWIVLRGGDHLSLYIHAADPLRNHLVKSCIGRGIPVVVGFPQHRAMRFQQARRFPYSVTLANVSELTCARRLLAVRDISTALSATMCQSPSLASKSAAAGEPTKATSTAAEVPVSISSDDAKTTKACTLLGLYRFADLKDAVQLSFGWVALIVSGTNQPLQLCVFGQLMDSFNLADKESVKARVHLFAGLYASLGLLKIVTSSVQTSCFAAVAARQALRP